MSDDLYYRDEQGVYDDVTEIYMLDNLAWRMPTTDGFYVVQSQKFLKSVDPDGAILPAPGSVPVVREVCGRCGGYGGEQVEDGWLSCYRCCELGYEYTPLDMYLMEQLHIDALEDDYMRELDKLPFEVGDPSMTLSINDIERKYPQQHAKAVVQAEAEDDIPF